MSENNRPLFPLIHKEIDTCNGCVWVTYDANNQELSKEEIDWINKQMSSLNNQICEGAAQIGALESDLQYEKEQNQKLREAFEKLKQMTLQEREWRLEDVEEIGDREAKESLETLSFNIDKLLEQTK